MRTLGNLCHQLRCSRLLRVLALAMVLLVVALALISRSSTTKELPTEYKGRVGALHITLPVARAPFLPTSINPRDSGEWRTFSFLFAVPELDGEARSRTKTFKPDWARGNTEDLFASALNLQRNGKGYPVSMFTDLNSGEQHAGCSTPDSRLEPYGLRVKPVVCPKYGPYGRSAKHIYQPKLTNPNEPVVLVCKGVRYPDGTSVLRVCTLHVIKREADLYLHVTFSFQDLKYWRAILDALSTSLLELSSHS